MTKTRQKMSSLDVISRVFSRRCQQIYIYFRFRGMSFILKICQTVAGISMVRQFHDFLKSNFGRVFDIRPYCAAGSLLYVQTPSRVDISTLQFYLHLLFTLYQFPFDLFKFTHSV